MSYVEYVGESTSVKETQLLENILSLIVIGWWFVEVDYIHEETGRPRQQVLEVVNTYKLNIK